MSMKSLGAIEIVKKIRVIVKKSSCGGRFLKIKSSDCHVGPSPGSKALQLGSEMPQLPMAAAAHAFADREAYVQCCYKINSKKNRRHR